MPKAAVFIVRLEALTCNLHSKIISTVNFLAEKIVSPGSLWYKLVNYQWLHFLGYIPSFNLKPSKSLEQFHPSSGPRKPFRQNPKQELPR
jgi:hypothetical protein